MYAPDPRRLDQEVFQLEKQIDGLRSRLDAIEAKKRVSRFFRGVSLTSRVSAQVSPRTRVVVLTRTNLSQCP